MKARPSIWIYLLCAGGGALATAQQPDVATSNGQAGPVQTVRSATTLRMHGRYEQAIEAYRTLLESEEAGAEVEARCGLAKCYLETGRYADARGTLRAARKAGESSHEWHRTMAEALEIVGRYHQAIEHARRALAIDDHDHRARLLLGLLYEKTGRRDEAIGTYSFYRQPLLQQMPTDAANRTAAGGGFLRYSVLTRHPNLVARTAHTLQDLYQRAYQEIDRTYWPARLAAAELLREKFRNDQATEDYNAALRINNNLADAHVGSGWMALGVWNFEEAERRVESAKQCNPNSVPAWQLEAALRLTERCFHQALDAAKRALEINPNDVASLGYKAAASYCLNAFDDVEGLRERAYRISTRPSAFHRILGDTLGGLRQYTASEAQYKLAIEADPTDPHPRTELGLMYMQWGEESKARDALAASWELDNFDARTHNTLELLENLTSFARHDTEHFTIKYDASVDAVLPFYLADYLESIYDELCEDYEWTPAEKTVIEVFPTHRMFGVRITHKPWIHTIGACTGKVIAIDSPRRGPQLPGPYDVARVLRHEFTHTVTLAASGNRIAHWFTEGLATLQEDAPRSFEWRRMLAKAARRGELFTLESIDWAFIRPRRPDDRQRAYAQSEWMCEFISERFGYASLNRMIAGFRARQTQAAIIKEVLGVTPEQFDAAFVEWARQQARSWGFDLTPPEDLDEMRALALVARDDPHVLGRLARAELDAGNPEHAMVKARYGLEIDESNTTCLTVFGEVLWMFRQRNLNDPEMRRSIDEQLEQAMERLLEVDPGSWIASKALGTLALDRHDRDAAIEHFTRLKRVCPLDPVSDSVLAGVYLEREAYDKALSHLLELHPQQEHDAATPATIAMIYTGRGQLAEARYWLTRSLHIDPFNADTHEALADVLTQAGDPLRGGGTLRGGDLGSAVREYETLCLLEPKRLRHFERAAMAHRELGNERAAKRFARRAVEIDPETSVRDIIADDND